MLDFAWSEFLVVIIVAVIVIGPKQLPEVLYGLGRIARRLQYMKFGLSKQFEDFMEQADLNEIRNFKKTSFDMALHQGIEEEEVEEERKLANSSTVPQDGKANEVILPRDDKQVQ
jgi:Sec-independent protein translocase protein TatA